MNGSDLSDEIDALKAMILASQADLVDRDGIIERKYDHIQRLEKLVADFKRALFGAHSENVTPGNMNLHWRTSKRPSW